jgi:hypothetical protein
MKVKKAIIKAYYDLDGDLISFPDNPLHGKIYENVNIIFKHKVREICGISFDVDVIDIEGQEPIECELIDTVDVDEALIIKICQDWG